jgi:hypothetical protein
MVPLPGRSFKKLLRKNAGTLSTVFWYVRRNWDRPLPLRRECRLGAAFLLLLLLLLPLLLLLLLLQLLLLLLQLLLGQRAQSAAHEETIVLLSHTIATWKKSTAPASEKHFTFTQAADSANAHEPSSAPSQAAPGVHGLHNRMSAIPANHVYIFAISLCFACSYLPAPLTTLSSCPC